MGSICEISSIESLEATIPGCNYQQFTVKDITVTDLLFNLVNRSRAHSIVFSNVVFGMDLTVIKLRHVKNMSFENCRGNTPYWLLTTCSNIQRFIVNVTRFGKNNNMKREYYRTRAVISIIQSFPDSYRIVEFYSLPIEEECKLLLNHGIPQKDRRDIVDGKKRIQSIINRNIAGYARCRLAIYQLFLIKKYTDIFAVVNIDVIRIIARMLFNSLGTKIWCREGSII